MTQTRKLISTKHRNNRKSRFTIASLTPWQWWLKSTQTIVQKTNHKNGDERNFESGDNYGVCATHVFAWYECLRQRRKAKRLVKAKLKMNNRHHQQAAARHPCFFSDTHFDNGTSHVFSNKRIRNRNYSSHSLPFEHIVLPIQCFIFQRGSITIVHVKFLPLILRGFQPYESVRQNARRFKCKQALFVIVSEKWTMKINNNNRYVEMFTWIIHTISKHIILSCDMIRYLKKTIGSFFILSWNNT